MIAYEWADIATVLCSASVYGCVFSIFVSMFKLAFLLLDVSVGAVKAIIKYEGSIFDTERIFDTPNRKRKSVYFEILRAFEVIIYTIGFIITSYISFDGEIRLFVLLISIGAFFLFSKLCSSNVCKFVFWIYCTFLRIFTVGIRLIFYPIKAFIAYIYKKIVKSRKFMRIYSVFCHNISLDKHHEKC